MQRLINKLIKLNVIFILFTNIAFSWSGYDWKKNNYIDIEKGNLVREGEEIEFYDWDTGSYKYLDVEEVEKNGDSLEVIGTDQETGELRVFDMD